MLICKLDIIIAPPASPQDRSHNQVKGVRVKFIVGTESWVRLVKREAVPRCGGWGRLKSVEKTKNSRQGLESVLGDLDKYS